MTRTPQALRVGRPLTDDQWTAAYAGTLEDDVTDRVDQILRRRLGGMASEREIEALRGDLLALRLSPQDSAPGIPGPPVVPVTPQPAPGYWTSEFGVVATSIAVIALICGGMIYGTTQIESLSGEAKAIVYTLVTAVASWALKNLGINYTDNRTRLKEGAQ